MTEWELLQKLKEVSKLLDDFKNGKIEKSTFDWGESIVRESQEIYEKSHVAGAIGAPCNCCGGSGRN